MYAVPVRKTEINSVPNPACNPAFQEKYWPPITIVIPEDVDNESTEKA